MTRNFNHNLHIEISIDDEHIKDFSEAEIDVAFGVALDTVIENLQQQNHDLGRFELNYIDINQSPDIFYIEGYQIFVGFSS